VREWKLAIERRTAVQGWSRKERELDILELVQAGECPHPVRGRMPGREQDRLHRSAYS
jgi:hypothetical protein